MKLPDNLPPGFPPLPPVPNGECHCQDCNPFEWWMIVCDKCGNKRCPHALHHLNDCTNSNATSQHVEHQPRPLNRLAAFMEATDIEAVRGEPAKDQPATGVEARVCADIAARQRVGIAKYGCTVEESPDDMLRHAYEEALDLAVYLKAEIERRQTLLDQGLQDNRPPA